VTVLHIVTVHQAREISHRERLSSLQLPTYSLNCISWQSSSGKLCAGLECTPSFFSVSFSSLEPQRCATRPF